MRIFQLVWTYLRIAIANELQYRSNFFLQLLQSCVALAVGLVGLELVFSQTADLVGWTVPELLAVMGVYILMGGVIHAYIQPNMLRLIEEIQQGNLDFALTKPIDGQAIVSLREFHFWSLVDVVLGLIVLGVAVHLNQGRVGLGEGLAFVAVLLMGAVILYCFWLILSASVFGLSALARLSNYSKEFMRLDAGPLAFIPGGCDSP